MRYLLILIAGAGTASLYWLRFTGHDTEDNAVIALAILLTVLSVGATILLAQEEDKL